MKGIEGEEPGASRERRRKLARIAVILFLGIPVVYSVVMGVMEIMRNVIEDLR